jgi:hypothetical protein
MIIESKPVLLTIPDFAQDPEVKISQGKTLIDLSEAPRINNYTGKRPRRGWPVSFTFRTRAEIEAFEEFFYTQAGKWSSFWIPSWHGELNAVANLNNAGSSLSITPVNYATVYDPSHTDTSRPGHYIFLYDITGAMHVSLVNSVSGTSPEVLVLNTAASRNWVLGQFFTGFLYLVRFTSDTLALEYSGPSAAKCSLGVIEDIRITSEADA